MHTKKPTYITCMLILCALMLIFMCTKKASFSDLENKALKSKPILNIHNIYKGDFTKDTDAYIEDHIPFRESFVKLNAITDWFFNKKEKNDVIIAQDGYLFEETQGTEQNIQFNLNAIQQFAFKNAYLMLIPSAMDIYPEKLPIGYPFTSGFEKITQAPLKNIRLINLHNVFLKHKAENLFYKSDHHWTAQGAKLAYEEFCNMLNLPILNNCILQEVPNYLGSYYAKTSALNTKPENLSYWSNTNAKLFVDGKELPLQDSEKLMGRDKYVALLQGNPPYSILKGNGKGKLFVIKDSYANAILPLIAQNFEEIHIIDLRYYKDDIQKLQEQVQADVTLLIYGVRSISKERSIGFALQ